MSHESVEHDVWLTFDILVALDLHRVTNRRTDVIPMGSGLSSVLSHQNYRLRI